MTEPASSPAEAVEALARARCNHLAYDWGALSEDSREAFRAVTRMELETANLGLNQRRWLHFTVESAGNSFIVTCNKCTRLLGRFQKSSIYAIVLLTDEHEC